MRRSAVIFGSLVLFLALSAVIVTLAFQRADADTTDAVATLQQLLEEKGVNVTSISVDGQTANIGLTMQDPRSIEETVGRWLAYRVAAEQGYSWLNMSVNDAEAPNGYALRLLTVPHTAIAGASSAVQAWVEDVEKAAGVSASTTYADYRLDLEVEAPMDAVAAAAERFMMAGVTQHEAGNLDLLTLVIRSNGKVVFKGVADYLVGAHTRVYVDPEVDAD